MHERQGAAQAEGSASAGRPAGTWRAAGRLTVQSPPLAFPQAPAQDVYLQRYLLPFQPWLDAADVTEILVNRPGEVWVERLGQPCMQRIDVPAIDDVLLERLATQVARVTHQAVNREHPLLAATLPGGERVQVVAPPATRRHWALAIRRHLNLDLGLEAYRLADAGARDDLAWDAQASLSGLRAAVAARRTLLIAGGTSSGKTTFLNALLKEVPASERIVAVEDTPELHLRQPNHLGLVAVKGEQGETRITTQDLLQAALRLRPDRILLGEVRGPEAVTFLRAINTGHPGSFTTIHANTPQGALEQLALMVMQSGIGLSRADTLGYIRSVVDLVVQLGRVNGERRILAIEALR
nr:P-type DNA transfer ATPase VirB11 [Xanthomonas bonasiae]